MYALGTLETELGSFDSGMGSFIQYLGWQCTLLIPLKRRLWMLSDCSIEACSLSGILAKEATLDTKKFYWQRCTIYTYILNSNFFG